MQKSKIKSKKSKVEIELLLVEPSKIFLSFREL